MRIDASGQAFPSDTVTNHGLSMRDWFAGQALASGTLEASARERELQAWFGKDTRDITNPQIIAARAYEVADEMIKRRSKP